MSDPSRQETVDDAITTPVVATVHTVPAVYHGELLSVSREQVVIHSGDGLVVVPLSNVVAITP